jgi:hypothetical protein
MIVLMIILFLIGYTCIALEHPLKVNKSASALILCAVFMDLIYFPCTGNAAWHHRV